MFCFCLSKPQAWHIIRLKAVYHQGWRAALVSHHAPACIFLRLDDIQHFVLMIYNSFGIDDIHAFGVIRAQGLIFSEQLATDIELLCLNMLSRLNPCTPPLSVAGAHATALLKTRLHKSVRLGSESHKQNRYATPKFRGLLPPLSRSPSLPERGFLCNIT